MISTAACPACNQNDSSVFVDTPDDVEYFVRRSVDAVVRRCNACRSLFQDPWPSETETSTFYGPHYNNYAASKVPFLSSLHKASLKMEATRFIETYGVNARVLDFGCGHAGFLNALHAAGCAAVAGYDFSPERPAMLAREIAYFGTESELTDSNRTFDVIRLNHVIEHLVDYPHALGIFRALLSRDGMIMGQTPNAGHYSSNVLRGRWGNLHYPYHTLLLSRAGLQALAARTGFHVRSIAKTYMPTGWAMGFENIFKARLGLTNPGRTPFYTALIAAMTPLAIYDRLVPWQDTNIFNFEMQKFENPGTDIPRS